ncbi:MAG: type VI secretion system-associated protein TagF [Planctomycetota bacterium]
MTAAVLRHSRTTSRRVGCFGKLPFHGDFLRHNAGLVEMQTVDRWLGEGIHATTRSLNHQWEHQFDRASPSRLVYHSPLTGRVLAAHLTPARDRVGRRFPFLLFLLAEAPSDIEDLGSWLPAFEPFFQVAPGIVSRGSGSQTRRDFLTQVAFLDSSFPFHQEDRYAKQLASETVGNLFTRIFGSPTNPGKYSLMANVLHICRTHSSPRCVLRFPTCASSLDVGFWVSLVSRLKPSGTKPRMVLWNRPAPDSPAHPVVVLGRIVPQDFVFFLDPHHADPSVRDLISPETGGLPAPLPVEVRVLLDDLDLPLTHLLTQLPEDV